MATRRQEDFRNKAMRFLIGDRNYRLCQSIMDDAKFLAANLSFAEFRELLTVLGEMPTDTNSAELLTNLGRYIAANCNQIPLAYRMAMSRTGGLPLELSEKIFSYSGHPALYEDLKRFVDETYSGWQERTLVAEEAKADLEKYQVSQKARFKTFEKTFKAAVDKVYKKYGIFGYGIWYQSFGRAVNFEDVVDRLGITDFLDRVILFNAPFAPRDKAVYLGLVKEFQPYQTLVDKYIRLLVTAFRFVEVGSMNYVDILKSCKAVIDKYRPILEPLLTDELRASFNTIQEAPVDQPNILIIVLGALLSEIKANHPDASLTTALRTLLANHWSGLLFLTAYAMIHHPKYMEYLEAQKAKDDELFSVINNLALAK